MTAQSIDERLAAAGLPALPRRVWAEIDEDALAGNVAVFREMIGPGKELSAVVKADAYGHGLVPVARVFVAAGVDRLCVASLDEALALRSAGIDADIMVLFKIPPHALAEAGRNDIDVSVTDFGTIQALELPLESEDDMVMTEVEVDTGLTRGGFKPDELATVLNRVRGSPRALRLVAVWTHIASPEDEAATLAQVTAFDRAIELAEAAGEFAGVTRNVAATGGLLSGRVPVYEGVRIGIGLYGLIPPDVTIAPELRHLADRLRPAMSLKCLPIRVDDFPKGTPVSYGGLWKAPRESRIATLPIGYGDGWVRAYSPGASALVRGVKVPLVGSIAMDAVMADVTDVGDVGLDDEVVLIGAQDGSEIVTSELARLRTTIPWEIVTSMAYRLPRVYHAGPVLKGLRTLSGEARVGSTAE